MKKVITVRDRRLRKVDEAKQEQVLRRLDEDYAGVIGPAEKRLLKAIKAKFRRAVKGV